MIWLVLGAGVLYAVAIAAVAAGIPGVVVVLVVLAVCGLAIASDRR